MKKECGVVRIDPKLTKRIKNLLDKNNNKFYCNSVKSFISVSVIQLLEDIEKKDNKIRWEEND